MIILGSVLAALAAGLVLVGGLAWTRHLPGNKYVGIKVPEVRESREVWDAVHQFAGPLWVASGVAMAIAAAPVFSGVGWLLIISVVGFAASVYFFGLGSSIGARAAGVLAQDAQKESSNSCCGGNATNTEATGSAKSAGSAGSAGAGTTPAQPPAPAPQVDMDALRRAAGAADA